MVSLPSHLDSYDAEARQSLEKGLVKDIEFSGSTYQVLVEDLHTHEEVWAFLQLEGKGQIKDAFCSCDHIQEASGCLHLAVAYLSLFDKHPLPLHQRFSRSLWNQLCRLYSDRLGDDSSILTKVAPGHYSYLSNDKVVFYAKGKTPEAIHYLDKIMGPRPKETEETSLKFSNLPHEEILLWREGRPSPQLRYDLSFWSDLAKWMMTQQEQEVPYQLSFKYSKKGLPNRFYIQFPDVDTHFYISEANLSLMIPALNTVKSPLTVKNIENQGISSMHYDKSEGVLQIEGYEKQSVLTPKEEQSGVSVDGWLFVPQQGFYAEGPHILLKTPELEGEQLSHALSDYTRVISHSLHEATIHHEPVELSYSLAFDKEWNLHITAYLFEKGDLSEGDSRLVGDWVYLDEDGFYPLEGKKFETIETIIPVYQVADFVTQQRGWLSDQEGFRTHVRSIEYQLSYSVSANNRLTFARSLVKTKEGGRLQDFGSWVYLDGYGFYSKTAGSFNFLLRPGVSLSAEQIPLFIKMNHAELALIPGFFSSRCPVSKVELTLELNDKRKLTITPQYEVFSRYDRSKLRVFDDVVYMENEGFYELPADLRLPEKFHHTVELEGEDLNLFILYELEGLQKYIAKSDPRLIKVQSLRLVARDIFHAKDQGRGWYRFNLFYQTEHGLIALADLYNHLKKKLVFGFFKEGMVDLRDKRFDWLRQLRKDRIDKETGQVLLTTLEFMRLNAFDVIDLLKIDQEKMEESQALLEELTQLHTPEEPDVGGLVSHLRPYQEIGVKWLWFLYHQQLSGLLCDDMGLGKTHQAMALLTSVCNFYGSFAEGSQLHFLIVCPTSVIYHWQEKLAHFLPRLRVCSFYGSDRNLTEFYENYDVLLTSYGTLRNEIETLSKLRFEVAIFDEIQVAKNQSSRVYAALVRLKAQMKLGLTGTPIENHLRELKSLFDIVLPSYMPNEADYREFFIRPIEKESNDYRKDLLNRMIRPFTLRRKKEDVLTDLPDKIEEVAYCDLLPYQSQLYSEVLHQRRRHLLDELKDNQTPIPYLHIFALLSSLKQICDHPAVYLKDPTQYANYVSGKWNLFVELLREARESQQKVVVFSQYLGMLDIIEQYLTENKIGFASLRGATQNRKEQLQLFNQNPSCEVFVGSLQASGLGIDLTAGSVVIHYDRWWNAARENQATDRVHRIGQTKGVQVFKLVTKGTFEEKIDAMILRKGRLMEEVVGVDDQNSLKKFTRDELINLLDFVEPNEEHIVTSDSD